jgi:hypothetical protein
MINELTEGGLMRAAVHEAGHAVTARLLGLCLGWVWITDTEGSGRTEVRYEGDPQKDLRILAGSRACLNAFGFDTADNQGLWGDQTKIEGILDEEIPHADEDVRNNYMAEVDREVESLHSTRRSRPSL